MANKKGFVRYANNKLVAGSLILADKAPKVGVWKEVSADLCCNPSLYAVALVGPEGLGPENPYQFLRAIYATRDLQNIEGQCDNPSLYLGTKLYMDVNGTIPVENGVWQSGQTGPILFEIRYEVVNGVIVDGLCP
jgi:hypothetical protein